jgi:hypothetical protein
VKLLALLAVASVLAVAAAEPNHYSDTDAVALPVTGWTVGVPTIYYEKLPGEAGLTLERDVRVDFAARHFFRGRDPVLRAALTLRRPRR